MKTTKDAEERELTETIRETPQVGSPAFLKIAQDSLKGSKGCGLVR